MIADNALRAQNIAVEACQISKDYLKPGISEKEFAQICENIMQ